MARKPNDLSRADKIRARRQIEPIRRKPIERAPEESVERVTRSASRVVVRRPVSEVQSKPQAESSRGRRPVYIPTSTPGIELRLPSVPRVNISWRVVSGILSLILLIAVILMLRNDRFKVNPKGINIRGNFRVSNLEIAARLSSYGTRIIEVEPEIIERAILRDFRDIKNASVGVSLPANLNVRIEERIPAITWIVEPTEETAGNRIWIDQDGYSFEVKGAASLPIEVHANVAPPVPFKPIRLENPEQSTGIINEEEIFTGYEPDVDSRVVAAVQILNEIKPPGTILRYDAKRGLGWTDPDHGWMVYFGRNADFLGVKMAQYQKIAQHLLERNLQPSLISLEYLHAPYYR